MSLDKAIAHGKEHRKPYRGSKRYDKSCRNHGGCDYCRDGRLHKYKKREPQSRLEIAHNEHCLLYFFFRGVF